MKRKEDELNEQIEVLQRKLVESTSECEQSKMRYKAEVKRMQEENDILTQEIKTWKQRFEAEHREKTNLEEEEQKLRKEITKLSFTNDETNEKLMHMQRKYENAMNEFLDESRRRQIEEKSVKEDWTIKKLEDIEEKIAGLHVALTPQKETEIPEEDKGVDTESLLDECSESFEQKLENYQKHKGTSDNLLKKLTEKILKKDELHNNYISGLFKLQDIKLDDKANEYKNLLKAMGALYYANKNAQFAANAYSHWKDVVFQKESSTSKKQERPFDIIEEHEYESNKEVGAKENESKSLLKETGCKIRLDDIEENELNKLVNQIREKLIEELQEEFAQQKADNRDLKQERSVSSENDEYLKALYKNITKGLTDYAFGLFNHCVQYSQAMSWY